MRKRLYLLRHAKSSWKDASLPDHERPLAPRGSRAGEALAHHLREHDVAVELVLCSTARRTRETWELVEPALDAAVVRYERELYGASARTLLERLRRVPDETKSVMLIGHNPGIEQLALDLTRASRGRDQLERKYPTGALVVLEPRGQGWSGLARGEATLVAFIRPRDLAP